MSGYYQRLQQLEPRRQQAFMAARCEQDLYFVSKEKPAKKPRTFFQLLKKENSQTVFYNQIIKECKYLRAFAGK